MTTDLDARTKRFALAVIKNVLNLPVNRASEVLGRQLLKSATSVGANYREACRAQTRDDFIHKIALCEKEAAETEYWLELIVEAGLSSADTCDRLLAESRELLAIFVTSGKTAKAHC